MKLLTKEILERLPALYATEKQSDPLAQVKFFTPDSNWTWYATEFDPVEGSFFGLVDGFEKEMGYFSLSELEQARGPLGLPIERDRSFEPTPLSKLHPDLYPLDHESPEPATAKPPKKDYSYER